MSLSSLSFYPHVFEYFHILLCITVWLGSLAIPRQKIKIGILEIPPSPVVSGFSLALWLYSYHQIYTLYQLGDVSLLMIKQTGETAL